MTHSGDSGARVAIRLLQDAAERGDIDPWDVDVIAVIDGFLDQLRQKLELPRLVAAAGGTVLSEVNRQVMQDAADMVVWLDADPTTLSERTSRGAHRPLLDGDPASRLAVLDAERRALYASVADVSINTAGKSIQEVVRLVMDAVTAEHAS